MYHAMLERAAAVPLCEQCYWVSCRWWAALHLSCRLPSAQANERASRVECPQRNRKLRLKRIRTANDEERGRKARSAARRGAHPVGERRRGQQRQRHLDLRAGRVSEASWKEAVSRKEAKGNILGKHSIGRQLFARQAAEARQQQALLLALHVGVVAEAVQVGVVAGAVPVGVVCVGVGVVRAE